jgi:Ca2+-binding RTX toxin-like protein
MGLSNGVDYLLEGMGGADALYDLGDGDATLIGGGGNDSLHFGDRMRGGAGADILEAGSGANVLIGGEGQDVFRFEAAGDSAPGAVDAIVAGDGAQAFQGAGAAAGDRIDLSDFDADATLGGFQQLLWGGTGAGADTAKGRVWVVNGPGGDSLVRANIDLDAAAEFELRIADGARDATAYAASDFIVI